MAQGCTSDGSNFLVLSTVMFWTGCPLFFAEKVGGGRGQEGKLLRGRGSAREHGKATREARASLGCLSLFGGEGLPTFRSG